MIPLRQQRASANRLREQCGSPTPPTEITRDWIIQRLTQEACDYGSSATHSGRIRAIELLGKIVGVIGDRPTLEQFLAALPAPIADTMRRLIAEQLASEGQAGGKS